MFWFFTKGNSESKSSPPNIRILFVVLAAVLLILWAMVRVGAQGQQTVGGQVTVVSSDPTNCTLGSLFFNTTTNQLSVCKATVVTLMPDGQIILNQTNASVHNCKFQWVEGE